MSDCTTEYTVEVQRKIYVLNEFDRWIFAIMGPIVFFFLLGVILMFLTKQKYKKSPGDIIMAMNLADLLQNLVYQMSGWYAIINGIAPQPDGSFCQACGILQLFTNTYQILFDYAFAFSPILFISQVLKTKPGIYRTIVFIIFMVIIIGLVLNIIIDEYIALSPYGLCIFQRKNVIDSRIFLILHFLSLMTYLLVACFSSRFFSSKIPKTKTLQERAQMFLTFYQKFIIITICTYITIFIATVLEELNCYFYQTEDLNFAISLHNVTKLITPLLQCIVIILYYKFNVYAGESENKTQSIEMKSQKRSESIVGSITAEVKTITLYSIISGILLLFQEQTNDTIISTHHDDQEDFIAQNTFEHQGVDYFSDQDCIQSNELTFDEKMVKKNLDSHVQDQPVFEMKLISHAHPIFQYFQKQDHQQIDFSDSLSLKKNLSKMQELAGPQSGKSGEFFFFTHDHKLILKTIKTSELISFKKIFKNYGNYLYNHPESYLARIYGVLTFNSMGQSNAIIIMKNITMGLPREFIIRQFDLKGSEYDREVLNKNPNANLQKTVLKDLDFFKIEEKVWIDEECKNNLKKQLLNDAHFLQQQRLIDYSLFLLKIDVKGYQALNKEVPTQFIDSIKEDGVEIQFLIFDQISYTMGIIDYLQEWNVKKGLEREMKRVLEIQSDQQVSVQHPNVYGERFCSKLVEKILN